MNRKLLIMALGVFVTFGIVRAAVTFVAKPTRAGTLAEVIGDRLMEIDSLVVEGPINAGDFPVMKKATWDGNLSVVNLEKAQIDGDSIPGKAFQAYLSAHFVMPPGYYAVDEWKSKLNRVILPNTIKEIGDSAFRSARWLRTINLPDSLERIGDFAFSTWSPYSRYTWDYEYYSDLKMDSLVFSKKISYIGKGAFQFCSKITGKLVLPDHVNIGWGAFYYTNISSIEFPYVLGADIDGAFSGIKGLKEVRIPEHYPQISASSLFAGCSNLWKITLPDSWTYLPTSFLFNCRIYEFELPSHLVAIEDNALYNCRFSSIKFPEGFTTLGDGALQSCYSLTSIEFPEGFTSMGDKALYGCENLESVIFPEGFTSMGADGLSNCLGLKSIELPEGFTVLEDDSFAHCYNLEYVSLPSTLKNIGNYVFWENFGLKQIECRAVSVPELCDQTDSPFFDTNSSATIYVPKGSLEAYRNSYWNYFEDIREKDFDDSGVDEIDADQSEGDGVTYDLMGRKVSTPVAGGIYIRNGRKIIVK